MLIICCRNDYNLMNIHSDYHQYLILNRHHLNKHLKPRKHLMLYLRMDGCGNQLDVIEDQQMF